MFTGIIEAKGKIINIVNEYGNKQFTIQSSLASELEVDQSISHNGICLTVINVGKQNTSYEVVAIRETLQLTTADQWSVGQNINLERAALLHQRLDGHIVQGHIDTTAIIENIAFDQGSYKFYFKIDSSYAPLIIPKGSIAIDGVSLTVIKPSVNSFHVAIIPYTYENTIFSNYSKNEIVNIEFDIIGKYLFRMNSIKEWKDVKI